MARSWYSIKTSLSTGGGDFFNGFFSVDNITNKVRSFFDSTNPNVDIYVDNGFYGEDSIFVTSPELSFSGGGTNLNSFPYLNDAQFYQFFSEAHPSNVDSFNVDPLGNWIIVSRLSVNNIFTPISEPSCFNEGTKILCLNQNSEEEYIPIENLRKGDTVKSYKHGYKKIELIGKGPMINNPHRRNYCMYKMEKTEENGLIEDLLVTGGHSLLVDDLGRNIEENNKVFGGITPKIEDKYLLQVFLSDKFIKLDNANFYTYYHFVLENNGNDDERYGVWANGILTETPSKNQFNDHEYVLL